MIFKQWKNHLENGLRPPLEICQDPVQGYIVKALQYIPKGSILTEYVGEVKPDYLTSFLAVNDSLMLLKAQKEPGMDLVICPELFANCARYISGINNSSLESKKKLNVI